MVVKVRDGDRVGLWRLARGKRCSLTAPSHSMHVSFQHDVGVIRGIAASPLVPRRSLRFGIATLLCRALRLAGCRPGTKHSGLEHALRPKPRESRNCLRPAGLSTLSVWSKACAWPSQDTYLVRDLSGLGLAAVEWENSTRNRLRHRSSDTISAPYRRKRWHGLAVAVFVPDPARQGMRPVCAWTGRSCR